MAKFLGFALLFVLLVAFVVPLVFLDDAYAMDRSTEVPAPRDEVHAVVSDLRTWKEWTVWNREADPTVVYSYTGEPGTVGQSMSWKGEELGTGEMTITDVAPGRVAYELSFGGGDPAQIEMLLEPRGPASTAVKWVMGGKFEGMPHERWLGLLIGRMAGPDFESGLANLRERFAAAPR